MNGNGESRSDFLWHVHSYTNEYIRFGDAKAGFIVAWSGALLSVLVSTGKHALLCQCPFTSWWFWVAAAAFATQGVSFLFAVLAIRPRLSTESPKGFIYWGSIRGHSSLDEFREAVRNANPNDFLDALSGHLFTLAQIAVEKYYWINRGILWSVAGGVICAVLILFHSFPE